MALIGKVVALTGTAYVIKDNGEKRELQLGDSVELGDTIQTMAGAEVELSMADGRDIRIPPNQLVALTEDLATIFAQEKLDGSVDLATIESVVKAIESGQDVNEVLEETAAGNAGGRTVYGFGFVNLMRISDVLNQFNFDYGYSYESTLEDDPIRGRTQDELNLDLNTGGLTSTTLPPIGLSLSATPSLSEAGGNIIYTVTMSRASTVPMTVTLDNGQTVNIPAGSTTGTVAYPVAPNEDVYLDATTVSATITSATAGTDATVINTTPAVTNITDSLDTTTLSLSATPSVAEGGTIVYTASLNNPAQTPVTVTLATGEVITIGAGATSGSISIAAPADDVYLDASTVSKAIASATGGNFENLVVDTTLASTSITDTVDVTTISITGSPSVAENGTASYTISLTNPTQTALTVNIVYGGTTTSGDDYSGVATVTIPAGSSTATFSLAMNDDALAEGTETLTVGIGATSGGNFESLVVSAANGSVTTNVIDNDVATVSLTATPTITEAGGTIVYTATITQAPVSDLTVTLDNGVTIVILAGQTTATGNYVLAPNEDVYIDTTTYSATITSLTGGGIISSIDPTPAVTNITDTVDTTTVSLSATPSVAEGGSIVYTATLTNPAQGAVTVTLSNGSVITIPNGATTGTVPVPAPTDDVYADAGTVSLTISTATGGNFENLVVNGAPAVTNITDTLDATTVTLSSATNGTAITEGGSIIYTATVNNAVTGSPLVVTLSNGATITIPVGQTTANSAAVPVRADDAYAQGTQTLTPVTITGTTGANYEAVNTTGTINNTVVDDTDATTVTLTASAGSVVEGNTITYTATVTNAVTGSPLVITLDNGSTITIPVGLTTGTSAPVIVRADDVYAQGNTTVVRSITGTTGGNYEALTTTSTVSTSVTEDADATTVTLSSATNGTAITEGGSIIYTATVNNAVTGSPLVVTLSNGATITIPVGQTTANSAAVPVRADDAYAQGTQTLTPVTITGTTGANYEAVNTTGTINNTVVDDTDATTVTLTASAGSVVEGNTITYTATVTNAVTGSPLVITLDNGSTITIPVGLTTGTSAPVIVRADDVYAQGNTTVVRSITGTTGGNYEALTTTSTVSTSVTEDADATTVTLSSATNGTAITEGGSIIYTATVNNAVTGSPLVVTLSNGATITIPVGQTTANSAAVPVRADDAYAQGTQTLTPVTITGTTGANYEAVNTTGTINNTVVDDTDATTVTLTASAGSVVEGNTITYTATVTNAVTGSPLVITLDNGSTITIPVGLTTGTSAPVIVRADDVYAQGNTTVVRSITGTTGGNYEALTTTSTVSTSVTEDADATTVTLSSATNGTAITEGGSIIYTATVNNAVTGSPLVVTLSNGATITIPVGQTTANSAAVPVRADDAYAQGTQTLTPVTITGTTGANYEAVNTTGTINNTVVDDTDATTVTLTASAGSVVEGNTITYTATVTNAVTGSPLVITLDNGSTITIPVGLTTGTSAPVIVRADDVYAQGNTTVVRSITGTTGGNYEALTTTSTVSTSVTEDADATTVTLSSATNGTAITEGGSIIYTATVNNAVTGSPLVVTLSNGATITIPVGQTTANSAAVPVRADDAYAQGTQTLTPVTITGTTGANYEAVNTTGTINNTVVDDTDATTVTLTASAGSVVEGNTITYTATVTNAVTGSPLVITLDNGSTITIPVGLTTGTSAPVIVRADDVYAQGNTTVVRSITGTTGGNYEALTTTSTVSTSVTEDADATTVTLSSATNGTAITEGGSIIYTATVNNAVTGSPLVVTLSNGATITIPVGQTTANSAAVPVRADDAYAQGTQTLTPVTITGTTGANYEAVNTTGTINNTVVDDTDATTVTLTASAGSVVEGNTITYTATVTNAVTGSPLVITLDNGSTITIPVGLTTGTSAPVIVRADDVYAQGNTTVVRSITGTTGGNYEALTTTSTVSTSVTEDADATTVTLSSATNGTAITEGGSIIYTATVNNAVTGSPLVVTLSNGATITIPVGQTTANSAAVPVRADDAYAQGTQTLTPVTITGTTGANYEAVNTTGTINNTVVDDTDATTLSIAGSNSVNEGASGSYTVSLTNTAQTTDVVVTLSYSGTASNGADYTGVTTVTIPAGSSSANFNINTIDDLIAEGDESFTVTVVSATGGNFENLVISPTNPSVTTTIVDNEPVPELRVEVNDALNSFFLNEGSGYAHFTVSLSYASGVNTTVSLALADGTAAGAGVDYGSTGATNIQVSFDNGATWTNATSATIPAGSTSFVVRTPVIDDALNEFNETFSLTATRTAGATSNTSASASTSINDNDFNAPDVTINSVSVNESAGTVTFTVSLSTASGKPISVDYATSNGSATAGADYASATGTLNFAPGVLTQTITIPITEDMIFEGNENFFVNLSNVVNAQITVPTGTATIIDNEVAPTVSVNNVTVAESAGFAVFTVSQAGVSSTNTNFFLGLTNGTATLGQDYTNSIQISTDGGLSWTTASSGSIPAGSTSVLVRVPVTDDTVFEANETFTLTANVTSGNTSNASATGTATINDNDAAPTIATVSAASVTEGGNLVHTVNLSNASSTATTFAYSLTGTTATAGTDFNTTATFSNGVTLSGGTLTVPAGVTSFTVTYATVNDTIYEPTETTALTVGGVTGVGSIVDNDPVPTISSVGAASVTEGGNLVHTVNLSNASSTATTFAYSLTGTTATAGTDFNTTATFSNGVTLSGGTLTVPAGVTSFTVTYATVNDTIYEPTETTALTVGGVTGVGSIVDNDPVPTISSVGAASVTEGGNLVHTVNLSNASSTATTFAYSLTGTTATAGTDFNTIATFSNGVTLSGGTLTVPAGVTSFTVTYATVNDTLNEVNETTALTIGSVTGVGTINDNDPIPTLSINNVSVNEAAGTATFTVTLSAASGQTVAVNYATSNGTATAGSDYTSTTGGLTFAPGVITQTITVPITNDTIFEGNETFNVVLSTPSNATIATGTGVGTIVDNDLAPTISSVSAASVTEGGNLVHTVSLSNASSTATTFAYSLTGTTATAGTDFNTTATFSNGVTLSGGTLTVPAGVTSFTVTYATVNDVLNEANETTALSIGGVTGVGTINDNDPVPTLSINNVSVNEAAGTATFTVTLNAASGQTVTVNYATSNGTATAGSDYTSTTGGLIFAPGVITQTITVPITNDVLAEASETFNVVLSTPANATIAVGTGVGTIIDNDQPPSIDLDANNSTTAGNNYLTTYTENGAGISIADTDIAITDVDSANLTSATITLTNAQAGDVLAAGGMPAGITANVVGNVVTLTGSASLASYQTAIRAITFSSTSENPSTTPRTINVVVNDGQSNSNTAVTTINVVAVNDAPVGVADVYNGANSVVEATTVVRGNVLVNDTDVDSSTLTVAQFATNSGSTATNANGTNAITTALGGTVVMNADGTFTYTAPVRNHGDATSDVDSFVYRATDGSLNTAWTTVTINVTDSQLLANNDTDSVGIGGSTTGNVMTGAGGATADALGADSPVAITNVAIAGSLSNTLGAGNVRTIVTNNGTLVIDQDDGSYTYTSSLSNREVIAGTNNNTQAVWTAAGISTYGFDGSNPQTGANLNTGSLTAAAANFVRYRNNTGTNNDGLGVESSAGSSNNNRIESGEHLVLDLGAGFGTTSASVTLTDLSGSETATWRAYDASGNFIATGTITGNGTNIQTSTITTGSAFRYLQFTSGGASYRLDGLSAAQDLSSVTPDVFTYTIADPDGSTSSTTLTVTTDSTVTAVADNATVYEAALATGTQPTLTTEAVTGNLLANDTGVSGTTEITNVNGVTPVGGVITIADATGTLVVYTQASGGFVKGDYVYTLNAATDEGVNDAPSFNYVLTNTFNSQTTNSTLNINIVDDAPVRIGDITQTLTSPSLTTYNLVLVIDRSGSMAFDAAGRASTDPLFDAASARMLIAKDALAELVKKFDGLGNVNVKIVDFSSDATETNWYIDDTTGAIDYINNIQPTGGTQYSTALNELMTGYTQPPADKTLIYFVTDGDPNAGFGLTTTSTPTIAQWENFVQNTTAAGNTSPSIAFGVGIGPSVSLTNLLPIAYPNNDTDPVDGQEDYAIRVVNPSDLAASLLATVDGGLVAGTVSVVSGAGSTSGFLLGADGGSVQSILVDGVTYSRVSGGPTNVTINTNKGGQLEVDWVTGTYTYSLVVNATIQNQQEVFVVTAVDGDGDSANLNLVINLDYIANLDANRDTILTNVTGGTPINISSALLLHNDTLVNGTGNITGTSGAVNGTVSGTSNIVFNPTATTAKTIQVEAEALLSGSVYDNTSFAMNNVRENAVDLTDRTRYGTVLPGGQAWAVDVAGKTQVFSGRIANTATVKDVDYVKVRLFAGERIFIDVDNQTQNMIGAVEYFDGTGTLVSTSLALAGNAPNAYFTAPTDGEYYIRVESSATGTAASTNYNLLITLDQISGATDEHGQFDYTLNSGSGTTGATADIYSVAGTTIRGGEIDEVIIGGNTNDTLYGNGGNDAISGGAGIDTIYGGDGADRLDGGLGNDVLDGGAGNDILIGGTGNDILTGGTGSDTFVWNLADNGTVGTPASDTITDFNTAANVDKLDLRDLLQGETASGVGANLDDYLHFEKVGANTVLHISNTGAFSSGFNAAQDTQVITLNNVDLVTGFADDQAIIQNLLNNNKLITD